MAIIKKPRKTPFQRAFDQQLEDLRDDCIALFINSGLTQKQVSERGGPTPQTISRWLYKETMFPRLATIQSFTQAIGYRILIVPASYQDDRRERLDIASPVTRMPPKPVRRAKSDAG